MTDNTDNIDHTAPKRRLRVWHVLLGIFVILLLIWPVYYMRARANFDAACEKIRAAGYPITLAELNDWYKLPEGEENAADTILEALSYHNEWEREKAKQLPFFRATKLALDEPYDANTLQLAEEYLADNKKMITLLGEAAKIKHARYPVDLTQLVDPLFVRPQPYLGDIKRAVQTLTIAAGVHAENGRPEKAIDTLETMAAVSHSLAEEPILLSQLVLVACDALTVATAQRVISRCDLSDTQLQRLADMIKKMQTHSSPSVGFVGERCSVMSTFEDGTHSRYACGHCWRDAVFVAARVSGLAYNDMVIIVELLTDVINAGKLPLDKQVKSAESIQKEIDSLIPFHLFAYTTIPGVCRTMQMNLRYLTYLRVAQTAIAAEKYRRSTEQLPQNLTDLVPEYLKDAPIDPFDGKPLRYKKSDEGFMVYSIGENKIDEGGLKKGMKDIVFEIRRAYTKTPLITSK